MSGKEGDDPLSNPILEHAESSRDVGWIEKNLSRFWHIASGGQQEFGPGAIIVRPHTWEENKDENYSTFNFVYSAEENIKDEGFKDLIERCDPENQFVIIIEKQSHLTVTGAEITSAYKVTVDPDKLEG